MFAALEITNASDFVINMNRLLCCIEICDMIWICFQLWFGVIYQ